jgi:hypothetical protein
VRRALNARRCERDPSTVATIDFRPRRPKPFPLTRARSGAGTGKPGCAGRHGGWKDLIQAGERCNDTIIRNGRVQKVLCMGLSLGIACAEKTPSRAHEGARESPARKGGTLRAKEVVHP